MCDKGQKSLEAHPAVDKTQISLHPKGATIIDMNEELSVEDLQYQLNELNGYTITKMK
ncbi:copper resistance protein CopZ [Maribacter polysaccharolyticus]|uniref:copper resistance protein CopZ n=1 Tax=Maribacter polysaccharolyticus TaxID=3020831 RepID=UPI00237FC0FE|nr:copper resistance protein CopZ [Maribacter polysaccharolyticus]MDE3741088.1 copper resistance protein CopZ [Maribacter polysaccharolyticus]